MYRLAQPQNYIIPKMTSCACKVMPRKLHTCLCVFTKLCCLERIMISDSLDNYPGVRSDEGESHHGTVKFRGDTYNFLLLFVFCF